MKKSILYVWLLLLLIQEVNAQQNKKKYQFKSINNTGVIIGQNSSSISLQTSNGFELHNNWYVGVGIAYDQYEVPSIPVFIDVRKYLNHKEWRPFIYVNTGMNFTLHNSNYPKHWSWNGQDAYIFKTSIYEEVGLGINKSITKTTNFFISAGWSIKQFSYAQIIGDARVPPILQQTTNYNYDFYFKRLSIKMGISL